MHFTVIAEKPDHAWAHMEETSLIKALWISVSDKRQFEYVTISLV